MLITRDHGPGGVQLIARGQWTEGRFRPIQPESGTIAYAFLDAASDP